MHPRRRSGRSGPGRRPGLPSLQTRFRRTHAFRQDGSLPAWASGLEATGYVIVLVLRSRVHTDDEGWRESSSSVLRQRLHRGRYQPEGCQRSGFGTGLCPASSRVRRPALRRAGAHAPARCLHSGQTASRQPALSFPLTSARPPVALRQTGFRAPALRPCSDSSLTASAIERPRDTCLLLPDAASAPKRHCKRPGEQHPRRRILFVPRGLRRAAFRRCGAPISGGVPVAPAEAGALATSSGVVYRLRPPRRIGMVRGHDLMQPRDSVASRNSTVGPKPSGTGV